MLDLCKSNRFDVSIALECIYAPKQKPGLKTGALEGLTRRVGASSYDLAFTCLY
jgi:hypothetical protein